jgi:hypothetical protein
MPLSEDSRALLQLLLGRGKSYSDISGLLGIDEAEVRNRATQALAEIDPSGPAPDAELTDYLLGQADPISKAEVTNRISADPALKERTDSLADQLRLLVPAATLPGAVKATSRPDSASTASTTADAPESKSGRGGLGSISSHQRRLIAVLLGAALLAVVVILLVTGVFGGSDDDGDRPEPSPTVAVLQPVGNEQGSGQVQFGFAGTSLAANLGINDLEANRKGQGYVIWLYGSTGAFPIYATRVGEAGAINGQIEVNEAAICLIATDVFPTLRVSRVSNKDFTEALQQARATGRANARLPEYTGQTVLEGQISMPQDAKDTIVPICNGTASQAQQ